MTSTPDSQLATRNSEDDEFLAQLTRALGADYRIEDMIGEGGFGRVYSAADVRLGRRVAIKVIRPELAGARAFVDRFRKEGTALAKFRHPGIVPIYDIREQEGLIYYVMPLISGPTLRTCLSRQRQLSVADACRVGKDVLDALEHAHKAHIMHRDVKPENIIISGQGAVLVDFGVARAVEVAAGDRVTAAGMTVGTAGYMSPEQATGALDLDYRTDLYAVGCVLFESLAGRPPFAHRNQSVVLQLQLSGDAPDVRTFRPDTPAPLAAAVTRALQRRA